MLGAVNLTFAMSINEVCQFKSFNFLIPEDPVIFISVYLLYKSILTPRKDKGIIVVAKFVVFFYSTS